MIWGEPVANVLSFAASVLCYGAFPMSPSPSGARSDRPIAGAADGDACPGSVAQRLGYPADARLLMLHADDFGMAHSENRATIEALEAGWVDSASLMVPCPWFPEAAAWARRHPDVDLGIHLTLNSEWKPFRWQGLTTHPGASSLLDANGYLHLLASDVIEKARREEVEREACAQIEAALEAGLHLSHLDAHMLTATCSRELLEVYLEMGRRYRLPVLLERHGQQPEEGRLDFHSLKVDESRVPVDRILGIRPGVDPSQWMAAYQGMLEPLPPGVYMLMLHLGYDDDEMRGLTGGVVEWGSRWRQADLDLVRNPEFQDFLGAQGFIRVGWKDLIKAMPVP